MPAGPFDPTFDEAGPLDLPAPTKKADKWKELAPLLAILPLALSKGGRVGGAALLQGFQRSRQQQVQESRQSEIDAENRSYRNATLENQRAQMAASEQAKKDAAANAEATRRQTFLTQFNTGLEGIDTPEAAQAYLALQQAQGRTIGVNPDELARLVPSAPALSQKRARKALEQLQKARPDDWMNWKIKVDGQDVKATDLLGLSRDPGAPMTGGQDLSKSGLEVQLADAYRRKRNGDPKADADIRDIESAIASVDKLRRDPPRQPIVVTVGGSGLTAEQIRLAGGLRDDYRAQSKDYFTVRDAYERVQAAATNPTPAGDVALLYAYMKILDPGSVVRETEFATAAKTGSLPQQIQAAALRVINGQRLTPEQRADFVSRARNLYTKTQNRQNTRVAQFKRMSKSSGLPDDLVIVDEAPVEEAAPSAADSARAKLANRTRRAP